MADTELLSNRYRILKPLGSGGFSTTYLAEDIFLPSGRRCVIKQLKSQDRDPHVLTLIQERFHREAAILEELGESCRQIPRLYAYFNEGDQFYLVQEWIDGETLSQLVARRMPFNEAWLVNFLRSLLQVLVLVHEKRIIHRDIKPDNILLRRRDSVPVLIDFGAVKESVGTAPLSPGSPHTITIGTPGFMPTDQLVGRPVYSSDLYALGLTALFLLTGRMPEELPINSTTGRIHWSKLGLAISDPLTDVLEKATEPHPRDRFGTAQEMLEALPNAVALPPLPLSPPLSLSVGSGESPIAPTQPIPMDRGPTVPLVFHPTQRSGPDLQGSEVDPAGRRPLRRFGRFLLAFIGLLLGAGGLWVAFWGWQGFPSPQKAALPLRPAQSGSPIVAVQPPRATSLTNPNSWADGICEEGTGAYCSIVTDTGLWRWWRSASDPSIPAACQNIILDRTITSRSSGCFPLHAAVTLEIACAEGFRQRVSGVGSDAFELTRNLTKNKKACLLRVLDDP